MRVITTGLGPNSRPIFGDRRLGKFGGFSGGSPLRRKRAIDKYRHRLIAHDVTHGHFQSGFVQVADLVYSFV